MPDDRVAALQGFPHAASIATMRAMSSALPRAVYLDLVTTGPEPRHHRVLEVAAVRVELGRITQTFHRLVNPGRSIPAEIAQRTGIAEKDVAAGAELRYVLPELFQFLGADPVVVRAGEARGRGFLETAFGCRLANAFLDPAELAFLVQAPAPGSRDDWPVRALAGAQALVGAVADLMDRALALDPALRAEIGKLARGTRFGWMSLFALVPATVGPLKISLPEVGPTTESPAAPAEAASEPIDAALVADVFAPERDLARLKPGFEFRPQQAEMARAVVDALNQEGVLLVEAGTGVGKSFAYLIPLLLWARGNRRPVMVSTHTRVLQGQLDSDLGLLRALLDWEFPAVVVKGRSNYLCLNKWIDAHNRALADAGQSDWIEDGRRPADDRMPAREALAYLLPWILQTRSGDWADELPLWLQERLPAGLIGRVTTDAEHCLGRRCPQYSRCFVTHVRERARQASLVIVNHSLLMECLLAERDDILPHRCPVVIDEAHHLENVATHVLSAQSSRRLLAKVLRELNNPADRSGLLPLLLRQLGFDPDPAVSAAVHDAVMQGRALVEDLGPRSVRFFSRLQEFLRRVRAPEEGAAYAQRVRVTEPVRALSGWEELRAANQEVRTGLSRLHALLHHLDVNVLGSGGENAESRVPRGELDGVLTLLGAGRRAVLQMLELHAETFEDPQDGRVYWLESALVEGLDGAQWEASLHAAPLEVGPAMESLLFDRHPAVILTSATLTTSSQTDEFRFVRLRLGLDRLDPARVRYVKLLSPFDYARQVLFLLIADLPRYEARQRESRRRFFDGVKAFLPEILRANHGGALVLCTSHEQVEALHGPTREALATAGIEVLRQTRATSTRRQVERFRADLDAVLFGTYALWEGIDVPGESLDCLAIVKLPFDPPSDPLIEARREQTIARGLDGNHHYYYPLAIMRLKQGFGRLIRNTTDRGVFLILDNRLATRAPYAKQFLNSLPPGMQQFQLLDRAAAVRAVERWRAGDGGAPKPAAP